MEIVLNSVTINSYKGIDKSRPVFLDLGKAYQKNRNITVFQGDQGTGKSSTMEGIMYLLAYNFGKNPAWDREKLMNQLDDTINEQGEIDIDGVPHRIRVTKDKFFFEMFIDKLEKWQPLDEPKNTLQKLIGPLGISPMFLKERNGEKQIEWFRETFSVDPEAEKKETALEKKRLQLNKARTEANRDYTNIKKALQGNDLYQDYEQNAERFKEEYSIEAAQAKFEAAKSIMHTYSRAISKEEEYRNKIDDNEMEIVELEAKLKDAKDKKVMLAAKWAEAQRYIAEHATDKLVYESAEQDYMNINKTIAEQSEWKKILQMEQQMNEFETVVINLDEQRDKVEADLEKLTKKYLPEIEGLEIRLPKGLDDDTEKGIYFHAKTPAQLSESELWGLYLRICLIKGIRFVFIENISGLGTDAIAIINELAKQGVKIFASQMNRKIKSMKFTMIDELG